MHLWDLIRKLPVAVRPMLREPKGPGAMAISVTALAVAEIVLAILRHHFPDVWLFGELIIVPVAILAVALGYLARDPAPGLPNVEKFFVTRAALLHGGTPRARRKRAEKEIGELLLKVADPLDEARYIGSVLATIKISSVWAVCGRKSDSNAQDFWDANVISRKANNYIERVFFPPSSVAEATAIYHAIRQHIAEKMLVRAFGPRTARAAREPWCLPPGFGMTLMGTALPPNGDLTCDPGRLAMVLVHWGGVEVGDPHYGVILEDEIWMDHFRMLFKEIRGNTHVVNADGKITNCEEFLSCHPHYQAPGRSK